MSSFNVTKTRRGNNEDGTPRFSYTYDGPEEGGLLVTGPVSGSIRLADGTVYDVTEPVIGHEPGHAGPIMHHIEKMHEASGALERLGLLDFAHTCTDACGPEAAPI